MVGIGSGTNEQRTRDLTPPSSSESDNRFSPGNGGAERFLTFLTDELIPYVEKTYRTRPYRVLVGHSFGGLFAIHTLVKRPGVFNAYLAIDPSLHWNNRAVVAEAQALFARDKELNGDLYMAASFTSELQAFTGVRQTFDPVSNALATRRIPRFLCGRFMMAWTRCSTAGI